MLQKFTANKSYGGRILTFKIDVGAKNSGKDILFAFTVLA